MCGIVHPYDKAMTGNRQSPFGQRERPLWCEADPDGLTGRPSSRGPNGCFVLMTRRPSRPRRSGSPLPER